MKGPYDVGYTFGVFDIFHIEHLDHVRLAQQRCDYLVVGVLSDGVVAELTGQLPVNPFHERLEIVRSLQYVDAAVGQMTPHLADVWDMIRFSSLILRPGVPGADAVPRGLAESVHLEHLDDVRTSKSGLVSGEAARAAKQ